MRATGSRRGFTLVEILFATTASMLLVGGVLGSFIVFSRIYRAGVEQMGIHSRAKIGTERLASDIRAAETVVVPSGGDRLQTTFPATTLRSAVNPTHTTIHMEWTGMLPPSGVVYVDEEEISYTGKDSKNLLGCVRGCHGTTAVKHDNKTVVYTRFIYYLDGAAIYLNSSGTPSIATDELILRSVEKRHGTPLFQLLSHNDDPTLRGDRVVCSFKCYEDKNNNDLPGPDEPALDLGLEVFARNN